MPSNDPQNRPHTFDDLFGTEPRSSFTSGWEQYWYRVGLAEGFDAGKEIGYRIAVDESYPELKEAE
jgi:hypothetical protein